jgi:uncharacterized phage infection (PIP) family protein YhgE
MKTIAVLLLTAIAAVSAAQEIPTLEELQSEREQLRRQLEETEAQIEKVQGPAASQEDEELRDWQHELEEEFNQISEYLDELPRELSAYYVTMQKALNDLVDAIDEGFDDTRESAREKIAAAERRYRGTRETAYNMDRLHELRTRAEELNATEQAAPLIESFERSLAAAEKAQARASAAETELDRTRKAANIAGRKLETLLMQIETQQMEESLK